MSVSRTNIVTHTFCLLCRGMAYFPYGFYSLYVSLYLDCIRTISSEKQLQEKTKKFPSSTCEGGRNRALRPQMSRQKFTFFFFFNLLPGRGANKQLNGHMLNAARNTKREREKKYSQLSKIQVLVRP